MARPWPILLLAQELGAGGTERQLAETVLSLDRSEFVPHVGCFRPVGFREEELRASAVPVAHFPVRSFKSWSTLKGAWWMARYLRRHAIQLVHAFDVPMDVFATPVARAAGAPCVLSSQRAHRDLTPGWMRRALRFTDGIVDGIVVNSQALRQHLIEDECVAASRIHLCYNGINTTRFHPAGRSSHPGLVIGAVCVLRPEKGLPTLIEAFARLDPRQASCLRIVGDGPVRGELEALSARLGVGERVRLEPATNQVAERLREIDIFVLPSLSEGLSNSLMEAMACGCAPVASRAGGNPELVTHEQTGLLFEPSDASGLAAQLGRLAADPALRARVATAASERIRTQFSIQAAARQMSEIYRGFLEARG